MGGADAHSCRPSAASLRLRARRSRLMRGAWARIVVEVETACAMALADGQRTEMGRRAHAWMQSELAWPEIGARMSRCCHGLVDPQSCEGPREPRLMARVHRT